MFLNIFILFFVFIFLVLYYEETVVILAPTIPFIGILKVPFHFPSGLFGLIIFFILFLAPFKLRTNNKNYCIYPFIFLTLLVIFSYFISNIGENGKHLPSAIITVFSVYIYPIIFWKCINTPKHARLFIRSMIVFLTFVCFYAFYELITNSNPIIKYFLSNDLAFVLDSDRSRYGLKRLQSFLTYNGALGCTCAIGFVTLTYLKIHFKDYVKGNSFFVTALQVASFLCVIFTGTRSVIAGLMVGLLSFLEPKLIKKNILRYVGLCICFLMLILITDSYSYILQIIDSFQNTRIEGDGGGSNVEMRGKQLNITLHFWAQSPIVGNGTLFMNDIIERYPDEIFGAESVWFSLLTDYGIVGCIVFLISIFSPIVKLIQSGMPLLSFLPLLFLVDKSMSSIPGIPIGYHLLFVVFFLRLKFLTNNSILDKNKMQCK